MDRGRASAQSDLLIAEGLISKRNSELRKSKGKGQTKLRKLEIITKQELLDRFPGLRIGERPLPSSSSAAVAIDTTSPVVDFYTPQVCA